MLTFFPFVLKNIFTVLAYIYIPRYANLWLLKKVLIKKMRLCKKDYFLSTEQINSLETVFTAKWASRRRIQLIAILLYTCSALLKEAENTNRAVLVWAYASPWANVIISTWHFLQKAYLLLRIASQSFIICIKIMGCDGIWEFYNIEVIVYKSYFNLCPHHQCC